jgi:hypothetical protein
MKTVQYNIRLSIKDGIYWFIKKDPQVFKRFKPVDFYYIIIESYYCFR